MSQFDKEQHFFDKKTIFAIVLVMMVIFGWQTYLIRKYPTPPADATKVSAPVAPADSSAAAGTVATESGAGKAVAPAPATETVEKFESEKISFEISSRGMGLKNVVIHPYKLRDGSQVILGKNLTENYINETQLGDKKTFFNVKRKSDYEFVGEAVDGETIILKTYTVNPDNYTIQTTVQLQSPKGTLKTYLAENIEEKSSSFLMPSFDHDTFFAIHDAGTKERIHLDPKSSQVFKEKLKNVSVASLGGHYFATMVKDKSPVGPELEGYTSPQTKTTTGILSYVFSSTQNTDLNYLMFLGPKDTTLLSSVDEDFTTVIDFGIFSWIAKPILSMLKMFYNFIGNYGIAIILVTLIIRMILLPLNISSFKSMKKMQEIQPQLKALKERFKNNPQQLQIETMNLMKVNKVNPLGGCLPMLLQLPIFIALYNVLAQSIELYQAPFMLWITDLSLKDPYFVLPVLMGITMYVQQKITPTTLDPAQAKAMQIMPVVFSLLMITLPSGLTLYIFISTLFGILQQYFFMNDKKLKNAKA